MFDLTAFEVKGYQLNIKIQIDFIVYLIDQLAIFDSTLLIAWYLYFCCARGIR